MDLDRIPLWSDRQDITVEALWKAYAQFLYLPRLANSTVLARAISDNHGELSVRRSCDSTKVSVVMKLLGCAALDGNSLQL